MKAVILFAGLFLTGCSYSSIDYRQADQIAAGELPMANTEWFNGSEDCKASQVPLLQVKSFDQSTFVIRGNKCANFEAPFMYFFIGDSSALLVDTGTSDQPSENPIYQTITELLDDYNRTSRTTIDEIIIVHTHGHGDHIAGDPQFASDNRFKIIAASAESLKQEFDFRQPDSPATEIQLGARKVEIFPIPGHHAQHIAIYDSQTRWLITGDSLYPGLVYVHDWQLYSDSIARLFHFTQEKPVSALMGTHIEMSQSPGEIYPIGSHYQPDEIALALPVSDLESLHQAMVDQPIPRQLIFNRFIVAPVGGFQKLVSGMAKSLSE